MNTVPIIKDLHIVARIANEKSEENSAFKDYLKHFNDNELLDRTVASLNSKVEAGIDCTECGNCCRNLMVNISEEEAERLAVFLNMSTTDFYNKYIEKGTGTGMMIINSVPCAFLKGTVCSVYECRFADCRIFPGLHLPEFKQRLFATFMHYGSCPIIFNVLEALKSELGFLEEQT